MEERYTQKIPPEVTIQVSTHPGLDYDGDKYIHYREGDYIVYEPGKGIYFVKASKLKSTGP